MIDNRLEIAAPLAEFVARDLAPGSGIEPERFWNSLAGIIESLAPRVRSLLEVRSSLQAKIDERCRLLQGQPVDTSAEESFLRSIGYLVPEPDAVQITTSNVDPEIALVAGPQLVVPVSNARYALNAANARWGSLYDALYGTDVIPESGGCERGPTYNPRRGERVIAYARDLLDWHFPLSAGSHSEATGYLISGGAAIVAMRDGTTARLAEPGQFAGYVGEPSHPKALLLRKHGLTIEILIDAKHPVGSSDPAGVSDVRIEAALTTIMDLEDSVATVDAEDKALAYRNWLGLMRGDLEAAFTKGGSSVIRRLNTDSEYVLANGQAGTLRRLSVMLVRIVGLALETGSVRFEGSPVPEMLLDAALAAWCALENTTNSRSGSVYVVCPKLHGPDEVALACDLLERVESALGMEPLTLKMGIMDEERRTSLNLAACLAEASARVVFINTGFLDRTGDEIHTSMETGPMIPKDEMKTSKWLATYEDLNVSVGLAAGLRGRGQIGKGMWARPEDMAAMLAEKVAHPLSGASTAWVPSPTAAVLHALHYLEVDVEARTEALLAAVEDGSSNGTPSKLGMLEIPVLPPGRQLGADEIQNELENNLQGILGYVSRWVGMGVGCSKVPNIAGVALMEDRATLRISSQHVANWLHHGIVTEDLVRRTMKRMAEVVDAQNEWEDGYHPMAPDFDDSIPFQAAAALVFEGRAQPNGYTERILGRFRLAMKSALGG